MEGGWDLDNPPQPGCPFPFHLLYMNKNKNHQYEPSYNYQP